MEEIANKGLLEYEFNELMKAKDFSKELVNFPYIHEYIQNLQKFLQLQQNDIFKLKMKLKGYKNRHRFTTKKYVDGESQTDLFDCNEELRFQKLHTDSAEKIEVITKGENKATELPVSQTDFVYEETTGLYYHRNSGYYYDAKACLFYNGDTGTYYYYHKENESYKFYSQIEEGPNHSTVTSLIRKIPEKNIEIEKKTERRDISLSREIHENTNAELKINNCCEKNADESSSINGGSLISLSGDDSFLIRSEEAAEDYPPCMRIITKDTSLVDLKIGSLFIVTCIGGLIGREGNHSVVIPDMNISKTNIEGQCRVSDVIKNGLD